MASRDAVVAWVLDRLNQVRGLLGHEPLNADSNTLFVNALDSMGFVEFLSLVAEDCGVSVNTVEQAAGRHYRSVGDFADSLRAAGLNTAELGLPISSSRAESSLAECGRERPSGSSAWLAGTAGRFPTKRQPAAAINAQLHRPPCWLEEHAGIEARYLWDDDEPLDGAADAARDCLRQAGVSPATVGALLVTSEAPPLLTGLAAALHTRLALPSGSVAMEIGGACTSFLAALWTARRLMADCAAVLVIAVEAHSRWLALSPTPAGEAAALFGDASAACLLTTQPTGANALCLRDIVLGTDGSSGPLLRIEMSPGRGAELQMDGIALAYRAVRVTADAVDQLCVRHNLTVDQLTCLLIHGGNGRMAALLARRLGLPPHRVCSETARTGNLGSASLPIAWTARGPSFSGPVVWTAVGSGLQWGAALFDRTT